jgi:dihydrofolate synthase / folylpolyglutamate synthase
VRSPVRFASLAGWLEWQQALHPRAIEPGLDRLQRVLVRTGWQPPRVPVFTIGGTNGKGSCVAMLDAILHAGGRRVGTFTSPHLLDYRERIRIDGRDIASASLIVAFERIADALGADTLTFFEFNALAALLVLESANPDAIVLEVGMGGRLDAVNVVDADVAIVASLGLDHMDWLGPDLESIAREKAGIFRENRTAIFGGREAVQMLEQEARRIGARLERRGSEFDAQVVGHDRWDFANARWQFADLPRPAMQGGHQIDNAATVLAALSAMAWRLPVARAEIERGLATAFAPGRFQRVRALGREWVLDVAHNPDAAHSLADSLAATRSGGRTLAVCGMLADKDVRGVLRELGPAVDHWFAATTMGDRGLSSAALAAIGDEAGASMTDAGSIEQAMSAARAASSHADRIVVFGSFHTVGPAFDWLRTQSPVGERWLQTEKVVT